MIERLDLSVQAFLATLAIASLLWLGSRPSSRALRSLGRARRVAKVSPTIRIEGVAGAPVRSRLAERRLAASLTQRELAARCGCSRRTIARAEQRRPARTTARLIAAEV